MNLPQSVVLKVVVAFLLGSPSPECHLYGVVILSSFTKSSELELCSDAFDDHNVQDLRASEVSGGTVGSSKPTIASLASVNRNRFASSGF